MYIKRFEIAPALILLLFFITLISFPQESKAAADPSLVNQIFSDQVLENTGYPLDPAKFTTTQITNYLNSWSNAKVYLLQSDTTTSYLRMAITTGTLSVSSYQANPSGSCLVSTTYPFMYYYPSSDPATITTDFCSSTSKWKILKVYDSLNDNPYFGGLLDWATMYRVNANIKARTDATSVVTDNNESTFLWTAINAGRDYNWSTLPKHNATITSFRLSMSRSGGTVTFPTPIRVQFYDHWDNLIAQVEPTNVNGTLQTISPVSGVYKVAVYVPYSIGAWHGLHEFEVYGTYANPTLTKVPLQPTIFNQLANSERSGILVDAEGVPWVWGNGQYGTHGSGTTSTYLTPTKLTTISDVVSVKKGQYHTIFLKSDGTVWSSGSGWNLGTGTTIDSNVPVQVTGVTDAVKIFAGRRVSYALKSDGTLWGWGENNAKELLDGTASTSSYIPVKIGMIPDVIDVQSAPSSTFMLKSDGTVWSWGSSDRGQLGQGDTATLYEPRAIPNLTNVKAISYSHYGHFGAALKHDGTVVSWGYNYTGQLGDGSSTQRNSPVPVLGVTGVTQIATGDINLVMLKSDGTVWVSGSDYGGLLGDGSASSSSSNVAKQVPGLPHIVAIAASYRTIHALDAEGNVWAWGGGSSALSGSIGDGGSSDRVSPVKLSAISGVTLYSPVLPTVKNLLMGYNSIASNLNVWSKRAQSVSLTTILPYGYTDLTSMLKD